MMYSNLFNYVPIIFFIYDGSFFFNVCKMNIIDDFALFLKKNSLG